MLERKRFKMALPVNCVNPSSFSPSERSEHEGEAVYCARLTKRESEHKGEVKTTTCGSVGVGEVKIGRILVKNVREMRMCRIPSKLSEKVNRIFILSVFKTLRW
jgi:hypothetical protein